MDVGGAPNIDSKDFIETANDLQVLDAISECYEEYKVLSRSKKSGRF